MKGGLVRWKAGANEARGARAAAILVGLLVLSACGAPGTGPASFPSTALTPPSGSGALGAVPDPGWRLRTLNGREMALGDTRGRPVVLNLWATWCPPCVEELASIDRLAERVADAGVEFLLVTPEDEAPVRDFLARRRVDLPVYLEETLAPEALGVIVLPTTFILDARGAIRLHHRGAAEWDTPEVEAFLRALSAEAAS